MEKYLNIFHCHLVMHNFISMTHKAEGDGRTNGRDRNKGPLRMKVARSRLVKCGRHIKGHKLNMW